MVQNYTIFTTFRCINECLPCLQYSKPRFKYAHIGRTEAQREGLKRLLNTFPSEYFVNLIGGDPLLNEFVLKLLVDEHSGPKGITFNPLSFITLVIVSLMTQKDNSAKEKPA